MRVVTLDPFLTWHLELLVQHDINILNTLRFKTPLCYIAKPLLSEWAAAEKGCPPKCYSIEFRYVQT